MAAATLHNTNRCHNNQGDRDPDRHQAHCGRHLRGPPGFLGALCTANTRWGHNLGLCFPGSDVAILVILLDLPEIGPWCGWIAHEQFEFGKGLRRDTTPTPGDVPDIAALIARLGDLPYLAVLDHLNLTFPWHQETHLNCGDFRLRRDVEGIGFPFVWDALTRIKIAMPPRCWCQDKQTPYSACDDCSVLPTGHVHQLSLNLPLSLVSCRLSAA